MSVRLILSNVKGLLLVLATIVALICAAALTAECEGTWVESSTLQCPTGSVCAEWDVGGSSQGSCCIDEQDVGTGHLEACEGPLL